jgi:ELWxxDGT repeat protein
MNGTGFLILGHGTANGSTLYFMAVDANDVELWRTDGTTAGTSLVYDIDLDGIGSTPDSLTPLGNRLLMAASDQLTGSELWIH